VDTQSQTGLTVCRIKNKFLLSDFEAEDGYRDVSLNVLFTADNGLKIIGEIQVVCILWLRIWSAQLAKRAACASRRGNILPLQEVSSDTRNPHGTR